MFTWSKNNRACTVTWSTLTVLQQLTESFNDSGSVKVQNLTFWNKAANPDLRKMDANALAIQMDNVFTMTRGAKYEANVTKEKAISDMTNLLVNGDKTIVELAETNDGNYLFWQEGK